MEQTTNLNLKKPATTDPVKISDINWNMDILDTSIKSLQDEAEEADSKLSAIADYVIEQGVTDGWTWRKWNSGKSEAWAMKKYDFTSTSSTAAPYVYGTSIAVPSGLFNDLPFAQAATDVPAFVSFIRWQYTTKTSLTFFIYSFEHYSTSNQCSLFIHAWGTWK